MGHPKSTIPSLSISKEDSWKHTCQKHYVCMKPMMKFSLIFFKKILSKIYCPWCPHEAKIYIIKFPKFLKFNDVIKYNLCIKSHHCSMEPFGIHLGYIITPWWCDHDFMSGRVHTLATSILRSAIYLVQNHYLPI